MANENKEIGEIVKKCKILLLDIEGTTTSISFVKDKLFPYAEENVKQFLDSHWESDDVKEAVIALRKLAIEDQEKSLEGVVSIPGEDASKEEQIEGVVKNVKWQMSSDRKVGPLKLLQGLIWKQGYDKGDIKGHVYDDVLPALEQWRSTEGKKIYIYSSGSVDAQKLLFGQSVAGNLLPHIDGHFDTGVGAKQEASSYVNILEKVGCKSEEILFLTDIVKEAEAAKESGLNVCLVSREGNSPLPSEAAAAFPVIHSLEQLAVTNKRKPDIQEEQPAKVPKTEIDNDVKSIAEVGPSAEDTSKEDLSKKDDDKPEQMEVEEAPTANEEVKEKNEKSPEVSTTVEEVTDATDIADTPVVDIEPVVTEEKSEKTDKDETEKMDADTIEPVTSSEPNEEPKVKNGDVDAPITEETPPAVITEIEEIPEKQDPTDVGEIIDIEPLVEEPPAAEEMEDLQNVGEVLEKECDEILSKVQNVTNLDNIPLKPLLNTIAEESMDTETVDSNDIVDRILDTELELETKQSEATPSNTAKDTNVEVVEEKKEAESKEAESKEADVKTSPQATNDAPVEVSVKTSNETDEIVTSSTKEADNEVATEESKTVEAENEVATEESKTVEAENEVATEESKTVEADKIAVEVESKEALVEKVEKKDPPAAEESKETKKDISEEAKVNDVAEIQVNGKATNGDAKASNGDVKAANLNGDATDNSELSSRLSEEDEKHNGANGDSNGSSNGTEEEKGNNQAAVEAIDIKVKSVAVEESHTDPIEQPSEA